MMWRAFFVFAAVAFLDFVWARYNMACAEKRIIASGNYAFLIYIASASVVVQYVHELWLIGPAASGAFCGTVASIWMKKKGY